MKLDTGLVHIVDDDDAMRDSLVFLLSAASLDARAYASAEDFLDTLSSAETGCIVTDARMPGMSGLELLRHLRAIDNTLPVVVMTGHSDVPMAVSALKAGAHDFIEKPFDDERMIEVVRSALVYRDEARRRQQDRETALARIGALTERERQVFDGLVAGQPNKIIAHELGISARTVEIYRANVMSKLGASSLSDVVRTAFVGEGMPDRRTPV